MIKILRKVFENYEAFQFVHLTFFGFSFSKTLVFDKENMQKEIIDFLDEDSYEYFLNNYEEILKSLIDGYMGGILILSKPINETIVEVNGDL